MVDPLLSTTPPPDRLLQRRQYVHYKSLPDSSKASQLNRSSKVSLGYFFVHFIDFDSIEKRIDLNKFLSFNWNHLRELSFWGCEWFNDDYWTELV